MLQNLSLDDANITVNGYRLNSQENTHLHYTTKIRSWTQLVLSNKDKVVCSIRQ